MKPAHRGDLILSLSPSILILLFTRIFEISISQSLRCDEDITSQSFTMFCLRMSPERPNILQDTMQLGFLTDKICCDPFEVKRTAHGHHD
jgi:hypothetical protein